MVMMFGDDRKSGNVPYVTWGFCVLTTIIYLAQSSSIIMELEFLKDFAFIPAEFSMHPAANFYRLFTATLLHGGKAHLFGNLLFLIMLGRSIENVLGSVFFGMTFFGIGAFAFLGSWVISPASTMPIIGNSGAVAFLLGGYLVLFPKSKIYILPAIKKIWVRPYIFAAIWLLPQIYDALILGENATGVAYWTHFGGVMIGVLAAAAWKETGEDTQSKIDQLQARE
jgi:membrane associated rhomboid family serine protease